MTSLLWDQAGQRIYESGLDRGVLYLSDGSGVPWNGLVSIDEDAGDDSSEGRYFDGVKYYDDPVFGDYSAQLVAFTYPDEFLDYEGVEEIGTGLFVDGQSMKLFSLSYRTQVGNDVDGLDYGYQIHIVYNLTATVDSTTYETLGDQANPIPFSWKISSVPESAPGYRPTAHVIFDSRYLNEAMMDGVEGLLYGTNSADPQLPTISGLLDFVSFFNPRKINPNQVTGLSTLTNASGDLTQIKTPGIYSALPTTRLVETVTPGFYHYV